MPRHIDLDKVESEAGGEPVLVTYKGIDFEIPPVCPTSFVKSAYAIYQAGDNFDPDSMIACLEPLFGDRFAEFAALDPSVNAILALIDGAMEEYGLGDLGESSASADSSPSNGGRSRPTSKGSTSSTSAKRASGDST